MGGLLCCTRREKERRLRSCVDMSEFDEYMYESPSYTPAPPRLGSTRHARASDDRPLPPSAVAASSAVAIARANAAAPGRKRRRVDDDALL